MNSSLGTTKNGGKQANTSGNALERFVENILKENGYTEFENHKQQVFFMRQSIGGKQYSKEACCGKSIYDTKRRCDFLVFNAKLFPDSLIIECKWQQTSGSVDEKYPFTVHNITKLGVPSIILIDGGGYKKSALNWLKAQVEQTGSLLGVYTMSEFQALVNKGFLG